MINIFADWPQCKVKNNFQFFFFCSDVDLFPS